MADHDTAREDDGTARDDDGTARDDSQIAQEDGQTNKFMHIKKKTNKVLRTCAEQSRSINKEAQPQ